MCKSSSGCSSCIHISHREGHSEWKGSRQGMTQDSNWEYMGHVDTSTSHCRSPPQIKSINRIIIEPYEHWELLQCVCCQMRLPYKHNTDESSVCVDVSYCNERTKHFCTVSTWSPAALACCTNFSWEPAEVLVGAFLRMTTGVQSTHKHSFKR